MTNGIGTARGNYLIKNGAVITVDEKIGTLPKADVLVQNGVIAKVGPNLAADGAEIIDADDMIVMPGPWCMISPIDVGRPVTSGARSLRCHIDP